MNLISATGFRLTTLVVLVLAGSAGCNNSRYGLSYDDRLPSLRHIVILPAAIEVLSRHTGGVMENRPDLKPDVEARTIAAVREVLQERGLGISVLPTSPGEREANDAVARQMALLNAVREAIVVHHYEFGESLFFEYPAGDVASVLDTRNEADAILCVYLTGIVPTAGREILKGTAFVVGVLTGIHVNVSTNEATLILMLIDSETGDVLWFNWHEASTDVRGKHRLRSFIRRACSHLLKPRK